MLQFKAIDPRCTADHLGLIPAFFLDTDPRRAIEQIDERYRHGGGWFDLEVGPGKFTLGAGDKLCYPGDPPIRPLAEAYLHRDHVPGDNPPPERIVIHEHAFVSIHQPDGSFRVARLD